jgi:hypothetical protein
MHDFGSNIVPLSVVGMFLNYAGNHILHYISTVLKRKIFFPSHRVTSIQLLASGEVVTTTIRKQCIVTKNDQNGHTIFSEQEQTVIFRSKGIVLSNGGRQVLHPAFYKEWFPFLEPRKESVLMTSQFLKKECYKQTMEKINENKIKNIVIIGASHSGFSAAWLMLNGPATYNKNNVLSNPNKYSSMPEAPLKSIANCQECCTCSDTKKKKEPKCGCICKCFGFFAYKDWDFDYEN